MGLRDEFLTALRGGEQYDALLELVHHHQAQGLPPQEAYEILHQIWLEQSFNEKEAQEGTLQDTLESVMEKVWYGYPVLER